MTLGTRASHAASSSVDAKIAMLPPEIAMT